MGGKLGNVFKRMRGFFGLIVSVSCYLFFVFVEGGISNGYVKIGFFGGGSRLEK